MLTVTYSQISRILFAISAFVFTWSDAVGYEEIDIKYIVLGVNCIILLAMIVFDYKGIINLKKLRFFSELKQLLFVALAFTIASIYFQFINREFKFFVIKELLYLITPMIYVFLISNVDTKKNKSFYFKTALVLVIFEFLYRYIPIINLKNILSISFIKSFSPFESNLADIFLLLFIYFLFTNKRILTIICTIFCYLSFKRTHVAILLLCIICNHLIKKIKVVNPKLVYMCKLFFIISPFIIMMIFSDSFALWFKSVFNMDLNEFTMSRFSLIMRVIRDDTFVNYGLGSTTAFLTEKYFISQNVTRFMHNDILRVYIECGFIGSIIFANNYINIARKSIPSLITMCSFFIIMFISHILTMPYAWILGLLIISYFNEIHDIDEINLMDEGKC